MPKILRIINRFNLGGPTYNVAYLTKYMSPEFETLLAGGVKDFTEAGSDHIVKSLGIEPVIISSMKRSINLFNDFEAFSQLKKIIKDFKPDIVHTHAAKAGTIGRLAAFSCKIPIVVHTFHGHIFHSYFGSGKTALFRKIEMGLAKRSTAIIAISEKQKEELGRIHRIVSPDKIRVIPLGFDLARFQENMEEKRKSFRMQFNVCDDEIAVGIIGRLVPVKNHSLFLNAIQFSIKNSSKKIRAFIIGDGEEKENLMRNTLYLQLEKTITFTSWIKEADWALAGMDILCLTSLNEGTPVSLIEAQAANKPIVTTNVGGIENVVIPDRTALLSGINDPQAYCQNLLRLIENEKMREDLSKDGWSFVKEKFHYSRLVNDTKKLYNELLEGNGS
jgi:glycosyltransferase involved in cell wall biosynthesis